VELEIGLRRRSQRLFGAARGDQQRLRLGQRGRLRTGFPQNKFRDRMIEVIAAERRIAADLQKQVWIDVPFIPMGEYWQTTAYRKDITGPIPGCFTVFYNVRRA